MSRAMRFDNERRRQLVARHGSEPADGDDREPTPNQIMYAWRLARRLGIRVADEHLRTRATASAFIANAKRQIESRGR